MKTEINFPIAGVGNDNSVLVRIDDVKPVIETLWNNCESLTEHLQRVIDCHESNSGNEPSLSCFHRAIDEAKQALEQLRGES